MNRVYVAFFVVFSILFSKYESFKILAIPSFTNLTGNDNTAIGANAVYVNVRMRVRVVKLGPAVWTAIALQSVSSDH